MFLALLAAMAGQFGFLSLFYGRFFADPEWYPIRHTAALVQDILDNTQVEKLPLEREWLQATLQRQIDIAAAEDLTIAPALSNQLSKGRPVYDGHGLFYMPIHGGTYLATMPSAFDQYKPLLKPSAVLISCLVMAIVAAAVGFFMTRPLARRLGELETAAERIRQGDIQTRVKNTPPNLIGNVGRCFNQMAERIQLLLMARQQLLSTVARKFQTPVREISRHLSNLSSKSDSAEVTERSQKIDAAVDDIEQMVTGLLLNEIKQRSEFAPPGGEPIPAENPAISGHRLHSGVMKFITRMCLGILMVLLLHQLFMIGVSQLAYKYLNTDPAWYPVRTMAALITRTVQLSDHQTLPARLNSLRKNLGRRIDLLSAKAGESLIDIYPREFAGQMTYGEYNGNEVFCAPVWDGSMSLLIAPDYFQYRRKPSVLFHTVFLVFGFLLTTLFGIFLSRPIIRNLKKLEAGIENIRKGDLGTRVNIPENRPTGPLARCLNHMAQRIQSLLEHQKYLIQAVAHEIRTPVSRIRFHLEMLTEAHKSGKTGLLVADIEGEIEELDRLVQELLTFSALEAMVDGMETAPVAIPEFLSEIIAYHRKTNDHIEIALQNTAGNNLTVTANPVYFKRAIQNILSNALRYAQKNVTLCCNAEKDGIRIDVIDDGPGIPANERETVFQPFTRLDGSRSRDSGSFGLGLAIVDRILSLHGGAVSIGDAPTRGARITTWWPNPQAPED